MRIRKARQGDAEAIAKVHVDTWRSTYVGVVPQDFLDNLSYEKRAAMWQTTLNNPQAREHLFVAQSEAGEIVGFTCGGPARSANCPFAGEIYAIYLLQEHQGIGVGKMLWQASARQLIADGMASLMLWVLEDNPSCGFYAAMGGSVFEQKWDEIGGARLKELAYGWSQLPADTMR